MIIAWAVGVLLLEFGEAECAPTPTNSTATEALSPMVERDGDDLAVRRKSGQAQLKAASTRKRDSHGTEGSTRESILLDAARMYEEAGTEFADLADIHTEAWFRAGEIRRSLRQVEEAMRCFQTATDNEEGAEFAARAQLEIAHLERRTDQFERALELYELAETRFPSQRKVCVDARTWQGKALRLLERTPEGHERLLSLRVDYPDFPVQDVRNVDLVAMDWIEAGRIEEARQLVDSCVSHYRDRPVGEGRSAEKLARDIEKALSKMRSRDRLSGNGS